MKKAISIIGIVVILVATLCSCGSLNTTVLCREGNWNDGVTLPTAYSVLYQDGCEIIEDRLWKVSDNAIFICKADSEYLVYSTTIIESFNDGYVLKENEESIVWAMGIKTSYDLKLYQVDDTAIGIMKFGETSYVSIHEASLGDVIV